MKVTIRQKALSDGRISLYLDVYQGRGVRHKESLGLYLTGDRKVDKETLKVAELVRTRRQVDVDAGRLGVSSRSSETIAAHMRLMADARATKRANAYHCTINHVNAAGVGRIPLHALTVADCDKVRRHLLRQVDDGKLMSTSAETYMQVFRVAIRQAYRHGDIMEPLHDKFTGIRGRARTREFLLLDEVRMLFATPYHEPYRSIFIFAVLTGLRMGELEQVKWSDLSDGTLRYYQLKTKKWCRRRISSQAIDALAEMRDSAFAPANLTQSIKREVRQLKRDGLVWPWFPGGVSCNDNLRTWLASAGISRPLTMHCLRHTYATLQLSAGSSVETVSGLLGHSNIKTTQIYIHLLDSEIDAAADRIKL